MRTIHLVGNGEKPNISYLLSQAQYHVIPGKPIRGENIDMYNRGYKFWKDIWWNIYNKQNSLDEFSREDFQRQDCIGILTSGDEFLGMSLHSYHNIRHLPSLESHYFKFYNGEFIDHLKQMGAEVLLSFEYFTLNPSYVGAGLSKVVMSLGQKVFLSSGADALIAPARTDNPTFSSSIAMGFKAFGEEVFTRNFPVNLIYCTPDSVREIADTGKREFVDKLWQLRVDSVWGSKLKEVA